MEHKKLSREFTFKAIGIVHSPYKEPKNVPIQASASTAEGTVEVFPEYAEGLRDIEGFSHLILLCHLHLAKGSPLIVKPFLDDKTHGVFATRSPARPNNIGLSIVKLKSVEGNILHVVGLDVIDGTALLDIKPYVPEFDCRQEVKTGWFGTKISKLGSTRDDGRFCK
ncbi:MAG: tRNA (N6-threonylcarbamoyladenosine(37)-N6)-methyltransferase TrmO [Candidatus Bathyarchaeia archaeon]|jgi:tRNA-Thr(GGU) m(6)t(6)A37 methyltransferase TsaA